jgi:hypothetical protein
MAFGAYMKGGTYEQKVEHGVCKQEAEVLKLDKGRNPITASMMRSPTDAVARALVSNGGARGGRIQRRERPDPMAERRILVAAYLSQPQSSSRWPSHLQNRQHQCRRLPLHHQIQPRGGTGVSRSRATRLAGLFFKKNAKLFTCLCLINLGVQRTRLHRSALM